jgi:hypothetical protein
MSFEYQSLVPAPKTGASSTANAAAGWSIATPAILLVCTVAAISVMFCAAVWKKNALFVPYLLLFTLFPHESLGFISIDMRHGSDGRRTPVRPAFPCCLPAT